MKETMSALAGQYQMYHARRAEFNTESTIPFRVSPEPLQLSREQKSEIHAIGRDMSAFIGATNELYRTDDSVRNILNTGKPELFCVDRPSQYLFIRPDLVVTEAGFSVCEVETSPFGLGLAQLLTRSYEEEGFEVMASSADLVEHVQDHTSIEGTIIYSNKTKQYAGQLAFLADTVFSGNGRKWQTAHVEDGSGQTEDHYRAFYLAECMSDPAVAALIQQDAMQERSVVLPSLTPHLEEKSLLAMLWDKRWEDFYKTQLGRAAFNHLRHIVPPTWIVGQEHYFAPGLPDGVSTSADLASLSRAKRSMVLKTSGFSRNSSWAEGVSFLHEKSADKARELLQQAEQDSSTLHIVQEFRRGVKVPISYEEGNEHVPMMGRVRLTPYFATNTGQLVAMKATLRENSDFIHGSSDSVNTAVM